ncbi:MAG TPA: ABC transporter substrate-binding protein [Actinomycetota bacterium]|nr:ABC transporter substrate-binding protein [Actinomycetota bacterium]
MSEQSDPGVLRVASTMTAMHLSGFIGELSETIARRLGRNRVEWVPMSWDKLVSAEHPPFDIAVQIVAIRPERAELVDFSEPFMVANLALLARKESPLASAKTLAEVKPYVLGGLRGGASLARVNDLIAPEHPPKEYDHPFTTGQALADGEVDGIVFPTPVAMALAHQFKTTMIVGQIVTGDEYGIVFDKGSPLRPRVNETLSEMRADGTWKRIVDTWFPCIDEIPRLS